MDRHLTDQASSLERLRRLRGHYAGKRCVVMGNGPSLNRMDLALLTNEYVWGVNRCFLLFDRLTWRPAFYVAMDPRAIQNSAERINGIIEELPGTSFFFPGWAREQGRLRAGVNVYWYDEAPGTEFSLDAGQRVATARTVVVAALQLAVYLGFNPIYLVGCDTAYVAAERAVEEGIGPELVARREGSDPDHFDPNYLKGGDAWRVPDVAGMVADYRAARLACDALGVTVYNATVGGRLEEFPRVSYERVFARGETSPGYR